MDTQSKVHPTHTSATVGIGSNNYACQKNTNMRLPRIWHFAAFLHILAKCVHRIFFPHILAFSVTLSILCSNFSDLRIINIRC